MKISVKFDECEVMPNYPDPTNKTIIDFNLDGQIIETLIVKIGRLVKIRIIEILGQ